MTPSSPSASPRDTDPYSPAAGGLLLALQQQRARAGPGRPLTDAVLAERIGVAVRKVIDLAAELIDAGFLVVATCDSKAPGRFLLLPHDDLAPAHRYAADLRDRGVAVMSRASSFDRALRAAELERTRATNGQLNLGGIPNG